MLHFVVIIGLLLAGFSSAQAHDPYEISSVVYVRSNRVELLVEMEFSTGVLFSGQRPSPGLSPTNWFESELPQLADLAGTFFQITAGNHALSATRTNVTLGVENHIRFELNFASTPYRPFRFVAIGIQPLSELGPYGVSLTVLDMVNQKVLGQTTLFADTAAVEFPSTFASPPPLAEPVLAVTKIEALRTNPPLAGDATTEKKVDVSFANRFFRWGILMTAVALGWVLLWFFRKTR